VEISNLPLTPVNMPKNSEKLNEINIEKPAPSIVLSSEDKREGDSVRNMAQELNTKVYLDEGYISSEEIGEDGVYKDQYAARSVYFFAENSLRSSTMRYIKADKRAGIMSLPTAKNFAVDADIIRQAAGVARLANLQSKEVIEVSALASVQHGDVNLGRRGELDATRLIYARVLRDSLDQGHKLWLLNTHEKLVVHLERLLGKEQIHRLGDTKEYMGSPTVPVAINPQDVVRTALQDETPMGDMKRQYLKQTLQGVSDRYLDQEMLGLLEAHDIASERSPLLQRTLRHRKALAYAGISAFVVGRALPIAGVEGFEGNAGIFFAIDAATVFPYTWGLIEAATAKKPGRRVIGGAIAGASFAAPYAYFGLAGNEYPDWVNAAIGGYVGLAGLLAVTEVVKDRHIQLRLEEDATIDSSEDI